MTEPMPRIRNVVRTGPSTIGVTWQHGSSDRIDLAGWIATGGEILAPLRDADVFATARLGDHGASVAWGEEDGDLTIDAYHLHLIAVEQRPFRNVDLAHWQNEVGLSNQEAADFLSVALSSWHAYKAGSSAVPAAVAMVCRAATRDPLLLNAHFRPRPKAGRPRSGTQ